MKFLCLLIIAFFVSLGADSAEGRKKKPVKKPYYGLTKKDYSCESVIRIRDKQGPDFAARFYFDSKEAKRIERCLNKRKDKQEIYYIVKE